MHVMVTCLVCCEWPGDISTQCLLNSRSCCLPQHLRSGLTPTFIMAECEYVRSISRRSPVPHERAAVAEATTSKRKFRRPWFKSASSNAMPVPRVAQLGSWATAWSASLGLGRLLRQEVHLIALDIKPLVNVAEVLVGCLEALVKKSSQHSQGLLRVFTQTEFCTSCRDCLSRETRFEKGMSEQDARKNRDCSTLGGSAVAEFVADVFLCPFQACRIMSVSDPSYGNGMLVTGQKLVCCSSKFRFPWQNSTFNRRWRRPSTRILALPV